MPEIQADRAETRNPQKPSIGRTVIYTLSASDAEEINRRRTNSTSILDRVHKNTWPVGAQAHIGNEASEGQEYPMVIVAVWTETTVNGQVFLDGSDCYWATSRLLGEGPGTWRWPVLR